MMFSLSTQLNATLALLVTLWMVQTQPLACLVTQSLDALTATMLELQETYFVLHAQEETLLKSMASPA